MGDGMLECEHDTPRDLHDKLWKIYHKYIGDQASSENRLTKKAGPYHEKGKKFKVRSWVIIDLLADSGAIRDREKAKAFRLRDELNEAEPSRVAAEFWELTPSTPP